jgi:ERF superfamily protein
LAVAAVSEPPSLVRALLAFQAEAPKLPRDKTARVQTKSGGGYSYGYTSLDTIRDQIGPLLTKHGLVWTALPSVLDTGEPGLAYQLMHTSGETLAGEMRLEIAAEGPQAHGSAITYARRYAKVAVLDLVADDDDDAQAAMPRHRESRASGTVDLRDQAKGLSDRAINVARAQVGLDYVEEAGNQPWKSLASVQPELAQQLEQALAAAKAAQ